MTWKVSINLLSYCCIQQRPATGALLSRTDNVKTDDPNPNDGSADYGPRDCLPVECQEFLQEYITPRIHGTFASDDEFDTDESSK
jgi:hypothetical protein